MTRLDDEPSRSGLLVTLRLQLYSCRYYLIGAMGTVAAAWCISQWYPQNEDNIAVSEYDVVLSQLQDALLSSDHAVLRKLSSELCWQRLNRQYDFLRFAMGYKVTFDEFLRNGGTAMKDGRAQGIQRTELPCSATVFFFPQGTDGWTVTVMRRNGKLQIAHMAHSEIDPIAIEEVLCSNDQPVEGR